MSHHCFRGVKIAADINAHHALEISRRSVLHGSDIRHANVVDQDIQAALRDQAAQDGGSAGLIRQIAGVRGRSAARCIDLVSCSFGAVAAEIEDVDRRAGGRKCLCNG